MTPISFICFLMCSCQIQGCLVVTPVFVQTGKNLLLDVKTPVVRVKNDDLKWKFQPNETHKIYDNLGELSYDNKTKIRGRYEGRITIYQNYSLHLEKMQQTDSGRYTVWISADSERCVDEYSVAVQDPVSPVKLTVNYVSNGSHSCNLTVTCSTRDSHPIRSIFTCRNETCSQEERGEGSKITTSGAPLSVYLLDGSSIVCNHSNQISSAVDNATLQHLCPIFDIGIAGSHSIIIVIVVFMVILVILVFVIAAVYFCQKKRERARYIVEHTVYTVLQDKVAAQPVYDDPRDDASGVSPSIYSLITTHTGAPGSTGSTKGRGKPVPESLYAQLEKSASS